MDYQINNFLLILKSIIQDRQMPRLEEPVDWEAVLTIATAHNLLSLVFEKVCQTESFQQIPDYHAWRIAALKLIGEQAKRTAHFLRLYQKFAEEGLHPIVMKGIICRKLYGNLENHRPSGDEDILIQKNEFRQAESILQRQGYIANWSQLTGEQIDKLQEVSFYEKNSNLHIELHLNPMGNNNALRREMNQYFTNVFEDYRDVDIDGTTIRTMNHSDHFLFLVLHAFKHFVGGGFGIRQMLDILLYDQNFSDQIQWESVREKLRSMNAELFLSDLIFIGNQYLGFELKELMAPNCPEELLEDLIKNGVFGSTTHEQQTAANMTSAAIAGRKEKGQNPLKTMVLTVFPTKSQLLDRYPQLQEKPWLLPVIWGKRWGRFLKHNSNSGGSLAMESIKISRKRIALLKKYEIL